LDVIVSTAEYFEGPLLIATPRGYGRCGFTPYLVASDAERPVVMALGIYFAHGGFTPGKYDEALKRLETAGAGSPKGRTLHVALESDGDINVFDIWESQEDFEAFGSTLMPILAELGVELKEPMIATVRNLIEG
jgi:hypothetical protein